MSWLLTILMLLQIGLPFPGPGLTTGSTPVVLSWSVQGRTSSGTSIATSAQTITTGDRIAIICGVWTGGTINFATASDGLSNTWTLVTQSPLNTSNFNSRSAVWTATAVAGGSDTFTCNPQAGASHINVAALGYTGATANDSGATDSQTNNSVTTGVTHSVTTTVTDTLITYSFGAANTGVSFNVPTGFATRLTGLTDSGNTFIVYDKSAVAAGAQSIVNNASSGTTPIHSGLIGIHP